MSRYEITRPIGLNSPCTEIESVCGNAHLYSRCGKKPMHLIVPLDSGAGRTTLVEYLTDMYKAYGILGFTSGLDDYIEVTVDGSSTSKIVQSYAAFKEAAIYDNSYREVAAVAISDVAKNLNGPQLPEFLKEAKALCDTACVVFFVNSEMSANEEKLVEKLIQHIGKSKIKRIDVEPYTVDDLCALAEKAVTERGIEINHYKVFHAALLDVVSTFHIRTVKDAVNLADDLLHYADFSKFIPTVDDKAVSALAAAWQAEKERSESK